MQFEDDKIDFVIPWVDGSDCEWLNEKQKYELRAGRSIDSRSIRYRDYGLLRYLFRGIEENCPWVNKVYFITNGQLPSWMNLNASKLVWIKHQEYIPAEYLPTFSANPIEMSLHRISELSERFVYFNDDFFLLKPIQKSHFYKNGLPVLNPKITFTVPKKGKDQFAHLMLNNVMLINSHFDARSVIMGNMRYWLSPFRLGFKNSILNSIPLCLGYFTGFQNPHLPSPFLKEAFNEVWSEENLVLSETMKHRFRSSDDVTQYLIYDWLLATRRFIPGKSKKLGRYFELQENLIDNRNLIEAIKDRRYPTICINDKEYGSMTDNQFKEIMKSLAEAFESILPNKCSFEK